MTYLRYRPSGRLAPFIESFWVQENFTDAATHEFEPTRVLPTGFVDVAFYYLERFLEIRGAERLPLSRVVVTGPQSTYRTYAATGRTGIVLARFWPGAARALLPQPLHELRGLTVDLADLIAPRDVAEMEERFRSARGTEQKIAELEAVLESRLVGDGPSAPVRAAVGKIVASGGRCRVGHLARALGLSERQLQRAFRDTVGVGPKSFARIVRFQRAIQLRASGMSWAATAHTAGYQDQSHLANDCRSLSGLPPSRVLDRLQVSTLAAYFNTGAGASAFCKTVYV